MILRLSCTSYFWEWLQSIAQWVVSFSPGITFLRLLSKLSKPIMAGQYCPLLQNCTTSTHYLLINCFPQKYELSLSSSKMLKQRRQKTIKWLSITAFVSLALKEIILHLFSQLCDTKPCMLQFKWRIWSIFRISCQQKHHFPRITKGEKQHVTIQKIPSRL